MLDCIKLTLKHCNTFVNENEYAGCSLAQDVGSPFSLARLVAGVTVQGVGVICAILDETVLKIYQQIHPDTHLVVRGAVQGAGGAREVDLKRRLHPQDLAGRRLWILLPAGMEMFTTLWSSL